MIHTPPVSSRWLIRPLIALAGSTLALGTLPGCAKDTVAQSPPDYIEQAPRAFRAPPVWDPGDRLVSRMLYSARLPPADEPELLSTNRLTAPTDPLDRVTPGVVGPTQGELLHVTGSWRQIDVADLLHVLLGDYLKRDYVLDPTVQGQISLEIDEELTRTDLMDLVGGIASVFNWSMYEQGGVLFIRPGQRVARLPNAPVLQAMPAAPTDAAAVRVRRLRYVAPDQIATLLGNFASDGAVLAHSGRMLVMADSARQIARLSRLVAALDVPPFQGAEIWTYRLANRDPVDAAQLLQTLIPASGLMTGSDPLAVAVALPGTHQLMIVARDATVQPIVRDLIRDIDRPAYGETRARYIYRVQHFPVADLYNLIRGFFADKVDNAQPGQTPTAGATPRISLQISANSDLLLITATPSDYAELLSALREIDRPPQQVSIQSIIAEVRLTNRLEFGVEYFLTNQSGEGQLELTGQTALTGLATGSAFFVGGDGFAIIRALDNESEARVLSQPHIVVQDHIAATIQVGGEVPVLRASEGSATQTAGTSAIREEITYRDTGIKLTIQPDINESGLVTLHITEEITDSLPTDIQNQPEFTTRTLETTVTVPHGQTVLLGGIISSNIEKSQSRIPILGRLPLIGAAFGQRQDRVERTELFLAITPTIINQPSQARAITSDFIRSANDVRAALETMADQLPIGSLKDTGPENLVPVRPFTPPSPMPNLQPTRRTDPPLDLLRPRVSLLFDPLPAYAHSTPKQSWAGGLSITTATWIPSAANPVGHGALSLADRWFLGR